MKKIWVKLNDWDKKIVTTALEGGAFGLMLPDGYSKKAKELGKIWTIAKDGDFKDFTTFTIKDGKEEEEIVKLSQSKKLILKCNDWTIIPLENLIAKKADIIFYAKDFNEAKTAAGILEKGVEQILVDEKDPIKLKKILNFFNEEKQKTNLNEAEITEVKTLGIGDRVCIDTCTAMVKGEGILCGNTSNALFLIHSESISNPYVEPRPFRVNAGPVHAYTKVPSGKTKYLSELKSGDSVLITNFKGETYTAIVGRVKIEKRPLLFIEAKFKDKKINCIVQNAETIRLTSPKGEAMSVVNLQKGDKVLISYEEGARHFGHKIDETINEK